jgi:hypothetical protein
LDQRYGVCLDVLAEFSAFQYFSFRAAAHYAAGQAKEIHLSF